MDINLPLLEKLAADLVAEYSMGDIRFTNAAGQAQAVIEIITKYLNGTDRGKWRVWANLSEDISRETILFEYDEKMANDRDQLAQKIHPVMWVVDKYVYNWVLSIPSVNFGDEMCDLSIGVEELMQKLFKE